MIICKGHSAPDSSVVYLNGSAWITVLIELESLKPLTGGTHSF